MAQPWNTHKENLERCNKTGQEWRLQISPTVGHISTRLQWSDGVGYKQATGWPAIETSWTHSRPLCRKKSKPGETMNNKQECKKKNQEGFYSKRKTMRNSPTPTYNTNIGPTPKKSDDHWETTQNPATMEIKSPLNTYRAHFKDHHNYNEVHRTPSHSNSELIIKIK